MMFIIYNVDILRAKHIKYKVLKENHWRI